MSETNAILSPYLAATLLGIFSLIWIILGWYLGRNNRDVDDFMLAGRKVGIAMATATAMATWVTSNTTMVAPQLAYQMGIWGMIGYSLGSVGLLLFAPMAARIRDLMPSAYTSGDFIRLRYGVTAWRVFLVISLVYGAGWLVSLAMAGGILIEALSGIDYWIGMTVILFICVLYTLMGGLKAVIGTDFIQTLIIITGVVILAVFTMNAVGFDEIHESLMENRPELLNLAMPAAIMFLFNNLLFGMGEIFHSNVWWSRAFAFGKGVGFRAYLLSGFFWMPIPIAAGFVALAAPALGLNVPSPDMVGPMVAAKLLGKVGAVTVFIVVFSALASSLDSLLAATGDLIAEDIYKKHINPRASKDVMRKAASFIIVSLGIIVWAISLPRLDNLASLLHFTGALVASTIWPITAGLYWKKTNPRGAWMAMVLGSILGLTAYFYIGFYVAALIGATVSMIIVIISTLLFPVEFDWDNLDERFEE